MSTVQLIRISVSLLIVSVIFISIPSYAAQLQIPGAIRGMHGVSGGGAFTYTIPIKVAPGISGIAPELSIEYNSNYKNGLLGMGWSLEGLSKIERCRATTFLDGFHGKVYYNNDDRFCLDGQRLIAVNGIYGENGTEYRTERDIFSRIISYDTQGSGPAYFVVESKDGKVYFYGRAPMHASTSQGSISEGAIKNFSYPVPDPSIFVWALSHVEDRLGNYMAISYYEYVSPPPPPGNPVMYRPTKIEYAGNGNTALSPVNYVVIEYEDRLDKFDEYAGGTYLWIDKRIKTIRSYADGSLSREYNLSYQNVSNPIRSRLVSVSECGSSECYPPTQFTWSDVSNSITNGTSAVSDQWTTGYAWKGDFNGDGLMDFASRTSANKISVRLSNGTGFSTVTWNGPSSWGDSNFTWVGDFNGDGKADIATRVGGIVYIMRSTGSNFSVATWGAAWWGLGDYTWVGDFNGDGRTDIATYISSGNQLRIYTSTGSSFSSSAYTMQPTWGPPEFTWAEDFNGDGLTDIVTVNGSTIMMYIKTHTGFLTTSGTDSSPWGTADYTWTGDFNGDGILDIATYASGYFYIRMGTGKGFRSRTWAPNGSNWGSSAYTWAGDFNGDGLTDIISAVGPGSGTIYVRLSSGGSFSLITASSSATIWGPADRTWVGDFNGNGRSDIVSVNGSTAYRRYTQLNNIPNLLKSITDGAGYQILVNYLPLTNTNVYSAETSSPVYPEIPLRIPIYVVHQLSVSDGIGGLRKTTYSYNGLRFHLQDHGFLGFNWIKSVDESTPTSITTQTFYRRDYPYIGLVNSTTVDLDGSDQIILGKTDNTWGQRVSGKVVFPFLVNKVETTRETDGSLVSTVVTTFLDNGTGDSMPYDIYGNPEKIRVETGDGYATITEYTYSNSPANWLINQPISEEITGMLPDSTSAQRKTTYEYYSNTGLLKSQIIEPDNQFLWLKTEYQYDSYGNRKTVTVTGPDITSRVTQANYTANGLFPQTVTNSMGHSEAHVYDPRSGLMTQLTGPNGLITAWQYDSLGNRLQESRADGTSTIWVRGTGNAPGCPATVVNVAYYESIDIGSTSPLVVYYDTLNREVQRCSAGFSGLLTYRDTQYNHLGQLAKLSREYFSGSTKYWAQYSYDPVGKIASEVRDGLNGQITYTYTGLTATIEDRNNNMTVRTLNSIGQLAKVIDPLGGENEYQYDHFGNLVWVKDASDNVTTMGYDVRGRKIWMDDPNMGYWQYQYNAAGDLIQQQDAKSQMVTMQYDKLGRMTHRAESEGTSLWEYDTATNGIGKLKKVSRTADGYEQIHVYDSCGRTTNITTKIAGSNYSMGMTYDAYSRLDTLTYPTQFTVRSIYDTYTGKLKKVEKADQSIVYWEVNGINPSGQITRETFGNNLGTLRTYNAATGFTEGILTGDVLTVQHLSYEYDPMGNLMERRDNLQSLVESFTYDELDRIASSQVLGQGLKTYQYDATGNIAWKTGVGTYTYGENGAGPHAVTTVTGALNATYSYDANGNMLGGAGRTISYTSFNKPSQIAKGVSTVNFQYDPNHQRMLQTVGSATVVYLNPRVDIGPYYEKETSGGNATHRHYIYGGSGVVAVWTTRSGGINDTRYLHKDHLDSIDTITDEQGNIVEKLSYDPFGKRRQSNWQDATGPITSAVLRHGFTGHEHLDAIELIHMGGRAYDPLLGRFISADPYVSYVDSTQGLNRYSYTDNNPLSRVDRSGYGWLKKTWKKIRKAVSSAWKHTVEGVRSAGRKIDKYKKEIIVVAAAIYTGGATLSVTGSYVAAGAASGFVTGAYTGYQKNGFAGAMINGAIGALAGGLLGAGYEYYGNSWTVTRVAEESIVGGFSSSASGGKFSDGMKYAAVISAVAGVAAYMRHEMAQQSSLDARNSSGVSVGHRGDGIKLAGERFDASRLTGYEANKGGGAFGGWQGQPGRFLGVPYPPGSIVDRLLEAYAGPHDYMNSWYWYDAAGNIRQGMNVVEKTLGNALSVSNIVISTPIVGSSVIHPYATSYLHVHNNDAK